MSNSFQNNSQEFLSDDSGATLVEYGIAIVLAVLVGVAGLTGLAGEVSSNVTDATTTMQ